MPRAVWYGVEFVRYALGALWLGRVGQQAYLRGHAVGAVFEGKVGAFSTSTKR